MLLATGAGPAAPKATHHGGDAGMTSPAHSCLQVGHEVGTVRLRRTKRRRKSASGGWRWRSSSRLLSQGQAVVGIGDDRSHPAETRRVQRAQELQPEGAVLARSHVRAQGLPLTVAVHAGGHDHALTLIHLSQTTARSDFLGEGLQPHVGIGTAAGGSDENPSGGHHPGFGYTTCGDFTR